MKIMKFISLSFILSVLIFVVSTAKIEYAQTLTESTISKIGTHEFDMQKGRTVEIKNSSGKTSPVFGNQLPYELVRKDESNFKSISSYSVKELCAANNKLTRSKLAQPNGKFSLNILLTKQLTADELIAKVIKASGGERNLRRITSRVTKFEIEAVNVPVKGHGTFYQKAPNKVLNKAILKVSKLDSLHLYTYFDGKRGGVNSSLLPLLDGYEYTGTPLEDIKFRARFHDFLDLNEKIEKAEILRKDKFAGEDVYVLSIKPIGANEVNYFISSKTFLVLKLNLMEYIVTRDLSLKKLNVNFIFEDYRKIDGVLIPFKQKSRRNDKVGGFNAYVKEVKHNVPIPDSMFRKQAN